MSDGSIRLSIRSREFEKDHTRVSANIDLGHLITWCEVLVNNGARRWKASSRGLSDNNLDRKHLKASDQQLQGHTKTSFLEDVTMFSYGQ